MLPQTPSSATGTIGASTSFMMRSKPRRNGSRWPMRVICPSAKMQTTSPARMASLAVCSDLMHFARALFGGNRNDAKDFGERLDVRLFVNALEHHEPHLPVGGRQQQHRVHK